MLIWASGVGAIAAILNITNADGEWRKRHGLFVVACWTFFFSAFLIEKKPADSLATKIVPLKWGPFSWEQRVRPDEYVTQWGPVTEVHKLPQRESEMSHIAFADAASHADRQMEQRAADKSREPSEQPLRTINKTVPVTRLPLRIVNGKPAPPDTVNMTFPVTLLVKNGA